MDSVDNSAARMGINPRNKSGVNLRGKGGDENGD